jgi:hypothetical protein
MRPLQQVLADKTAAKSSCGDRPLLCGLKGNESVLCDNEFYDYWCGLVALLSEPPGSHKTVCAHREMRALATPSRT